MENNSYKYEYMKDNSISPINIRYVRTIHINRFYKNEDDEKCQSGETILNEKLDGFKIGDLYLYDKPNIPMKADDVDFSVDINTYNFHLYPKEGECTELNDKINELHRSLNKKEIEEILKAKGINGKVIKGRGIQQFATSKYISVICEKDRNEQYWLLYETLYIDDENKVNSIAGRIQFAKTINRKSLNDGKITYPKLDGECIDNTIYNNTELTIDDDSQDIIDSFIRFIENN